MGRNPFGDEPVTPPSKANPFGDETPDALPPEHAAVQLMGAARKIRGLRTQLGAEGLTLQGTRQLIEELGNALEAASRALRGLDGR